MRNAVIYARVSSREQQEEGYSIEAQQKYLRNYAAQRGLRVEREFIEAATAKKEGRESFNEMLRFLQRHSDCRIVLVEKTDRLYRNFKDRLTFEELDVELHLAKEAQIISKESKSQVKLVHGFNLLLASHYSNNLKEEVEKGMLEKAEQGHYPAKAPFGYRNNKETRGIDPHPTNAPVLRKIFEMYSSGRYSLSTLRKALSAQYGVTFSKSHLERLLKNHFYVGVFTWKGREFAGKHEPIISSELFERVQKQFASKNRPRYQKHDHAFSGLLVCANDGHQFTGEIQKAKYTYYRCSDYGRDRCRVPYVREEKLSDELAQVLQAIHLPEDVCKQIADSFKDGEAKAQAERQQSVYGLQSRLHQIRARIDKMYEDKLDGKIDEDFWN